MLIKLYNKNEYVFLDKNKFPCERHFYEELMRIQFNKTQVYPNTIDSIKKSLNQKKTDGYNQPKDSCR